MAKRDGGRARTGAVKVEGLRELNRALRQLGPDARAGLKEASRKASELVAADAKAAAYTIGGVAAHVAPSIKSRAAAAGSASVAIGGARFPMAGGAEFGSLKFMLFKPWRGNGATAGYFLYPTIRQDADRIATEYTEALDKIVEEFYR